MPSVPLYNSPKLSSPLHKKYGRGLHAVHLSSAKKKAYIYQGHEEEFGRCF